MLDYEIFRHNWIFFGLGFGLILMIFTVLSYMAIWRERGAEKEARLEIVDFRSFAKWFFVTFPWVLILTFAATWAFALIYPFVVAVRPPNW